MLIGNGDAVVTPDPQNLFDHVHGPSNIPAVIRRSNHPRRAILLVLCVGWDGLKLKIQGLENPLGFVDRHRATSDLVDLARAQEDRLEIRERNR